MPIKPVVFNKDTEKQNISYFRSYAKKTKSHIDYEKGINALNQDYIQDDDDKVDLIRNKLTESDIEFQLRMKNPPKKTIKTENWVPSSKIIIDASQLNLKYQNMNELYNKYYNNNELSDSTTSNISSQANKEESFNYKIVPPSKENKTNNIQELENKPKRRPLPYKKNPNICTKEEKSSQNGKFRPTPPGFPKIPIQPSN